ncbi:hypothetical protein EDC01DRAFT_627790 [Geopyxis carbonaria]|nr:hypothetical protein EDC01DRAFT_627790 [Geopyxis carbonaria]
MSSTPKPGEKHTALATVKKKLKSYLAPTEYAQGRQAEKKKKLDSESTDDKTKISDEVALARKSKMGEGAQETPGPRTYGHPSQTPGWTPPSGFSGVPEWASGPPQLKIEKVRGRGRPSEIESGPPQPKVEKIRGTGHPTETEGWTAPSGFNDIPEWARELPQLTIEKVRGRMKDEAAFKRNDGGNKK